MNNIILEIPKSVRDDFDDPIICRICFDSKLEEQNKVIYSCRHEFCKNCVRNYLKNKIINGNVNLVNYNYNRCWI